MYPTAVCINFHQLIKKGYLFNFICQSKNFTNLILECIATSLFHTDYITFNIIKNAGDFSDIFWDSKITFHSLNHYYDLNQYQRRSVFFLMHLTHPTHYYPNLSYLPMLKEHHHLLIVPAH